MSEPNDVIIIIPELDEIRLGREEPSYMNAADAQRLVSQLFSDITDDLGDYAFEDGYSYVKEDINFT